MTTSQEFLEDEIRSMTPSSSDRSAASFNRSAIEAAVVSELGAFRIFETGSWSHGTAVRIWSDVDYFASMEHARPAMSSEDLASLRRALTNRVGWRAKSIEINRPAVSIEWIDGPITEIVPAHITSDDDYWIPDPEGFGWIKSSPRKHNEYVDTSRDLVPQTKQFVRLVKLWKYRRRVPITSLYLELRATKYLREHPPFHMIYDLAGFFRHLDATGLAAMNDPSRFDGRRIAASPNYSLGRARAAVSNAQIVSELATSHLGSNDAMVTAHLRNLIAVK